MKYYKVKSDSHYGEGLAKAREDKDKIIGVSEQVRTEFSFPESTLFSLTPDGFYQPLETVPEESAKHFKKDGFAKKNSPVHKRFLELLEEQGLKGMKEEQIINFAYGIMKHSSSETLKRLILPEGDFIETDTHFSEQELQYLEEISEVEFREIHLNAVKQAN